jgi:hypothetical protein
MDWVADTGSAVFERSDLVGITQPERLIFSAQPASFAAFAASTASF